jgi:hypothetical protein
MNEISGKIDCRLRWVARRHFEKFAYKIIGKFLQKYDQIRLVWNDHY